MLNSLFDRGHATGLRGKVVRSVEDFLGPGGLALLSNCFQVVKVARDERQLAAEGCEVDGCAAADARACAGDENNFSFQSGHFDVQLKAEIEL